MVEFEEKYNFVSAVLPHIQHFLSNTDEKYENTEADSTGDSPSIDDFKPTVIGQERNNYVLYTFFNKSADKPSPRKTYIALIDPTSDKSKLLFIHEKEIEVVNASINEEHTLLAFTVRDIQTNGGHISPGSSLEIYKSYLAEVLPQNRVFSLNIEWHTYQKVQFLYSTMPSFKMSHMLFFHHKESIGLYHIPVSKIGDGGYIMSNQPKTEQLVRQFLWCKFDAFSQRLYYVELTSRDEEELDAGAMFSVVQLSDSGSYKHILNFQLPLPFKMEAMFEAVQYWDRFLGQTVSNRSLNLEALVTTRGSLHVCYQHSSDENHPDVNPDEELRDSPVLVNKTPGNNTVKYTICCLHGGYSIRCVALSGPESSHVQIASTPPRLSFSTFGDYVVVYLPNVFFHLLDCGIEHEPVHHIFLTDEDVPGIADWDNETHGEPLFSTALRDYVPVAHHGSVLYENKTQKSYKVSINQKAFARIFAKTHQPHMRLAIMHASVVHFKDSSLTRKLIESICQDPANLESIELLKEYILAYSYSHIKRQLNSKELQELQLLPMTGIEPFRGQIDRNKDRDRMCHLTYKPFHAELIDVLIRQLRKRESEYWTQLKSSLQLKTLKAFHRFPLKQLAFSAIPVDEYISVSPHEDRRTSIFSRLSPSRRGSSTPTNEARKDSEEEGSPLPPRRESIRTNDVLQSEDDIANRITTDKLTTHLTSCMPRDNKTKIFNISKEYAMSRGKIIKSLWKHASKALGYSSETQILHALLTERASAAECALFQLLERLHVCCAQLCCPVFPGMSTIFITLGYRCLSKPLFLQYLDADVFNPTEEFVNRLLIEVPDEGDNVSIKVHVITRLPKEAAKRVLAHWNHPVAKRFLSQQLVIRYSGSDVQETNIQLQHHHEEHIPDQFLPLATFLRSLRLEETTKQFAVRRPTEDDLEILEASTLLETNTITAFEY